MLNLCELSITQSAEAIAILIKGKLSIRQLNDELVTHIRDADITQSIYAAQLTSKGKKPLVAEMKACCAMLLPALKELSVTSLYLTDTTYFGFLTGTGNKAAEYQGYALNCVLTGFTHIVCVLGVHPYVCTVNPDKFHDQRYAIDTLARYLSGDYQAPGSDVIHFADYPQSVDAIAHWLDKLQQYPELTCDLEAFSLKHLYAGLGTIAFAWDKHSGIAFSISLERTYAEAKDILGLLKNFFANYQGKLIYHNMGYDAKQLIYMLFMQNPWDYEGLLTGLEIMTRSFEDTKIISYLATNSAGGNQLGLKAQSKEFTGKYSEENIKDITNIPLPQLLEYNLKDCCATWYVAEKNYPKMVKDNQLTIYQELFKPAIKQIIQMELVGLPVNPIRVAEVANELRTFQDDQLKQILEHPLIIQFMAEMEIPALVADKNSKLKTKTVDATYFTDKQFNPNSHDQVARLLFEFIGFDVVSYTSSKNPSTDGDTLAELFAEAKKLEQPEIAALLKMLMDYGKVNKIVTAFIPAFEAAFLFPDNRARVFGSFNLGGTVSGRLSSSNPNLQNLPSNSTYAKLIKSCVQAPEGWLFGGLDFASLEDRISALTTKDKNKIKVYLEHYDGHCLRAFSYFGDQMPDIQLPEQGEACYMIDIEGNNYYFTATQEVSYKGQTYTGADFYKLVSENKL